MSVKWTDEALENLWGIETFVGKDSLKTSGKLRKLFNRAGRINSPQSAHGANGS